MPTFQSLPLGLVLWFGSVPSIQLSQVGEQSEAANLLLKGMVGLGGLEEEQGLARPGPGGS